MSTQYGLVSFPSKTLNQLEQPSTQSNFWNTLIAWKSFAFTRFKKQN